MKVLSLYTRYPIVLYTIYPIVVRRAWPTGCIAFVQPLGRVRRASKGILHTTYRRARAWPSARASNGILHTSIIVPTKSLALT